MNVQDMKLAALNLALECKPTHSDPDKTGCIEVVNFNKTFKITCWCYRLTEFSFYIFTRYNETDWSSGGDLTEGEAACFLKGMGLRSST